MRVVHAISSLDLTKGGPTIALVGLAAAQRRVGLDVAVCATWSKNEPLHAMDKLRASGVRIEVIGPCATRWHWHPMLRSRLERQVRSADVVHVHALWEEIQRQACSAAHSTGTAYVVRPCGMLDPWSLAQSPIRKRLYLALRMRKHLRRATAMHFSTDAERRLAQQAVSVSRSIVEPNGIDWNEIDELPADTDRFRKKFPEIANQPIVLFLSRLHPKKGLDLLLPAFRRGAPPDSVLVLAGPCPADLRQQLQEMARDLNMAQRVVFTGMLTGADKYAALSAASLFVLPSYQENFGNAVVEAMAMGVPVIVSDRVNLHDEVVRRGAGESVAPDIPVLGDAIRRWMADPEMRRVAGDKGRQMAKQQYDWTAIAQRWAEHYSTLVRN